MNPGSWQLFGTTCSYRWEMAVALHRCVVAVVSAVCGLLQSLNSTW
jgi:hypothetical protein